MPARPPVTVTILTFNEENNLPRAIRSVKNWADEIIVVDSGSTDRTREIAREHGAKVHENPWPGYGPQKNFAQDKATHDWILNIDADEEVPPELAVEIQSALERAEASQIRGFFFPRKTFYLGRWIRHGGWYPNHLVRLADRRHARWTEPQVHEHLAVEGSVEGLRSPLHHYSFPSIQSQVITNLKFSELGSQDLKRSGRSPSLFKLLLKPWWKFMDTYFVRRGFLDGIPGFIISVNAAHSMFLKYAYLLETRIAGKKPELK